MASRSILIIVLLICLAGVAILSGGCIGNEQPLAVNITEVTPQEAFDLIQDNQNDSDFLIIDIRTSAEFAEGHIEGAINIDFYQQTFRQDIGNLDRGRTYLIYCRTGNRSASALGIMKELNFEEIYHLSDGIVAWKQAGLPIVK